MTLLLWIVVLDIVVIAYGFRSPYPKITSTWNDGGDPGSPLFLTPYIEQGRIEEARNLSAVFIPDFPEIKSYSGFFTVDKTYNSNQFFWYFPRQYMSVDIEPEVYLWLQGGPGASSLYGLFEENGPFQVINDTLQLRDYHWSARDHVIYIDNPVGTGFSFTNDSRGYCTNQTQVGEHLYSTMIQFFQLFPELKKYNFIISGESYAGKYIPALGYTIHKKNPTAEIKINLKGLMIGDGWSDPINQLDYSDFLYQMGLLDWRQMKQAEALQNQTIELIKKKAWSDAYKVCNRLYSFLESCMGFISLYNFMKIEKIEDKNCSYCHLLSQSSMRQAIHVGNLTFNDDSLVAMYLDDDIMQSVAPWISELLEHYHMLFYNGQADIIVAYPLTVNFLRKLEFSGSEQYRNARKEEIIYVDMGENKVMLPGFYTTTAGRKLTDTVLRNSGHMVPADQPISMSILMIVWRDLRELQ